MIDPASTNTMLPPPARLEMAGIRISPYVVADADDLYEAVRESIQGVGRWLPWCHSGYGPGEAREWVERCLAWWSNGDQFAFSVRDAGCGDFLGGVGLNRLDRSQQSANLGYWVRSSCQRRGVATSAARLASGFGFDTLGLARIEIVTQLDNRASGRVAEKLGAVRQGTLRKRLRIGDRRVDAVLYAVFPPSAG